MLNSKSIDQQERANFPSKRPRLALLVSQYLGVNAHGAEAHTVVSLVRILQNDFEVEIVGGETMPAELEHAPHFVYFHYARFPRIIRKLLHIPAAFVNIALYSVIRRPALVLCTGGPSYLGIAALLARPFYKIKVVMRATEDYVNHSKFTLGVWPTVRQYILGNIMSMWALRHADLVISTGHRSREHFIKHEINRENIVAIPGPIQRARFYSSENRHIGRQALGLRADRKIIMYVGGLQPIKGSEELIEIIGRVSDQSDQFLFLVIGKEVRGSRITKALSAFGQDTVRLLPPQPHEDLVTYYQSVDALLFLTKVGVGYGQVNIEAALCNTPVVAWDPGLDVKEFLGECCFASIDGIVEHLLSCNYRVPTLLSEQDDQNVKSQHVSVLKKLAANI